MRGHHELGRHLPPLDRTAGEELFVAGSGSFAIEVADWATDAGWRVVGLVELLDRSRIGTVIGGHPIVGDDAPPPDGRVVVGLGGPRNEHWSRLAGHGWSAASVVHPCAHISTAATLHVGCVVAPGAVVGVETVIGEHALVSRGALVGHHGRIGDFVSLMPGVNIGGNVSVGERTTVGMGAVIVNGTDVGVDAIIAAGAVVLADVADGSRVQGLPAREYTR